MALDDEEKFPYFFRTVPSDSLVAMGMAEIILHFNWTRAVIITQDASSFRLVSGLTEALGNGRKGQACQQAGSAQAEVGGGGGISGWASWVAVQEDIIIIMPPCPAIIITVRTCILVCDGQHPRSC